MRRCRVHGRSRVRCPPRRRQGGRRRFERRSLLVSESQGKRPRDSRMSASAETSIETRRKECERRSAVDADGSAPGDSSGRASGGRRGRNSPRFPPSSARSRSGLARSLRPGRPAQLERRADGRRRGPRRGSAGTRRGRPCSGRPRGRDPDRGGPRRRGRRRRRSRPRLARAPAPCVGRRPSARRARRVPGRSGSRRRRRASSPREVPEPRMSTTRRP